MLVGQLAGGAAEHRGLLGFRHQVEVAPQALPADAVARDQVGALATAGGQRIAGVGALAPVAGEGGAGAVVEAASRLVVVGVAAVLGAEAFLLVVVGHREDIEAILLQLAEAPASADVALVAAAVLGGGGVAAVDAAFVQALAGDEVDHPADGIGAVQCGGAVAQHLDPVDGGEGNGVEIHGGAVDGIVRQTPAVEQHQGLVGADPRRSANEAPPVALPTERLELYTPWLPESRPISSSVLVTPCWRSSSARRTLIGTAVSASTRRIALPVTSIRCNWTVGGSTGACPSAAAALLGASCRASSRAAPSGGSVWSDRCMVGASLVPVCPGMSVEPGDFPGTA